MGMLEKEGSGVGSCCAASRRPSGQAVMLTHLVRSSCTLLLTEVSELLSCTTVLTFGRNAV